MQFNPNQKNLKQRDWAEARRSRKSTPVVDIVNQRPEFIALKGWCANTAVELTLRQVTAAIR